RRFPMRTAATPARTSSTHRRFDFLRGLSRPVASAKRSLDLEIDCGLFSPISLDLVLDGLSFVQRVKAGPLNGSVLYERVEAASRAGKEALKQLLTEFPGLTTGRLRRSKARSRARGNQPTRKTSLRKVGWPRLFPRRYLAVVRPQRRDYGEIIGS